jgi:hypothetical protein
MRNFSQWNINKNNMTLNIKIMMTRTRLDDCRYCQGSRFFSKVGGAQNLAESLEILTESAFI